MYIITPDQHDDSAMLTDITVTVPAVWRSGRLTCQVEVLQRRLRSDGGVQLSTEALDAMVSAVDLSPGCSDVVVVGDGGPGVDKRNL